MKIEGRKDEKKQAIASQCRVSNADNLATVTSSVPSTDKLFLPFFFMLLKVFGSYV